MPAIQKLSAHVIAQIAAGQVVDRPADIVKELIENALDAGANNIRITLIDGGITKLTVQDDGCGIAAEELELAVSPHATSKITSLKDLQHSVAYGFRGEALASIAHSGLLTVKSRTLDKQVGVSIRVSGTHILEVQPVGMSVGTTVQVSRLFDALPARKKFLKSPAREFQHAAEIVTEFAIAHPAVGFQLFNDATLILDYMADQTLADRLLAVYGKHFRQHMLPLSFLAGDTYITGCITTPQAATTISQRQYLYINNRPVGAQAIRKVVKHAYASLLPPSVQPPFVLSITINPEWVDANIHPQKREVALSEQELIYTQLQTALQQTLSEANLLYSSDLPGQYELRDSGMDSATAELLRTDHTPWNVKNYFLDEPILQINELYLVVQSANGVLLIDQHAAHERILYDEYSTVFSKMKSNSVALQKPLSIELPPLELQALTIAADDLEKLGFSLQFPSAHLCVCTAVPAVLQGRKLEEYLLAFLEDVAQGLSIPELDSVSHRTIAYLACRTAIKAGEVLTPIERKNVVEKLFATPGKYTCPHGRPVLVELTMLQLAQLFHRIPAARNEK